MRNAIFSLLILVSAGLAGCGTLDAKHPQCGRLSFLACLEADAARCDAMFDQARATCEQKQRENTLFETMPDTMKEGYLNRCVADDVATQSGQPMDKVKSCMRW